MRGWHVKVRCPQACELLPKILSTETTIAAVESARSIVVRSAVLRGTIAVPVDKYGDSRWRESFTACNLHSAFIVGRLSWYLDCREHRISCQWEQPVPAKTLPSIEVALKRPGIIYRNSAQSNNPRNKRSPFCSSKHRTVLVSKTPSTIMS